MSFSHLSIVMSKWAALKWTVDALREKEDLISKEFPAFLINRAKGFEAFLDDRRETEIAGDLAVYTKEAGEKGVYGALWEMGEELKTGFFVGMKDIPIKQETIEIADLLDLDPYRMDSGGTFLFLTDRGYELVHRLKEEGINASQIGSITEDNDRVILNGERRRFLTPHE